MKKIPMKKRGTLMGHGESSLGSHMMAPGNAADFLGVGSLALALELAVSIEDGGDVVDGALVELFEGWMRKFGVSYRSVLERHSMQATYGFRPRSTSKCSSRQPSGVRSWTSSSVCPILRRTFEVHRECQM